MESMRRLEGVLRDTAGYAAAWKAANPGKKIFGHFCTYTPEEIVHAAGIHPMRLFGSKGTIKHADAFLRPTAARWCAAPSRRRSPED